MLMTVTTLVKRDDSTLGFNIVGRD